MISESQLEQKGCRIVFEKELRTVDRNDKAIFQAVLRNNSYIWEPPVVNTNTPVLQQENEHVLLSDCVDSNKTDVWHLRLGHLNVQAMNQLKSRALNVNFYSSRQRLFFCELCVYHKMKATPYENKGEQALRPRQVICCDVPGPYPWSLHGFQYSVNLICKKTRKGWQESACFKKSDAEAIIKNILSAIDRSGDFVLCLETFTTDHGGEVL